LREQMSLPLEAAVEQLAGEALPPDLKPGAATAIAA
jgi:hypothetical protein